MTNQIPKECQIHYQILWNIVIIFFGTFTESVFLLFFPFHTLPFLSTSSPSTSSCSWSPENIQNHLEYSIYYAQHVCEGHTFIPPFHHYTFPRFLWNMGGNAWKTFQVEVNNGERRGWGKEELCLGPGGRCDRWHKLQKQLFPHVVHLCGYLSVIVVDSDFASLPESGNTRECG